MKEQAVQLYLFILFWHLIAQDKELSDALVPVNWNRSHIPIIIALNLFHKQIPKIKLVHHLAYIVESQDGEAAASANYSFLYKSSLFWIPGCWNHFFVAFDINLMHQRTLLTPCLLFLTMEPDMNDSVSQSFFPISRCAE